MKALCLLIDQAKCLGAHANASCKAQDIALYLDGREIKGLVPESVVPRADIETLQFRLDRSARSDAQWADLLGSPRVGKGFFDRQVAVSVGLPNDGPIPPPADKFTLVRILKWWFWICTAILVLAIVGIWVFGRNSALLKTDLENERIEKEKLTKELENLDKRAQVQGISEAEKLALEREKGQKEVTRDAATTKADDLDRKLKVSER